MLPARRHNRLYRVGDTVQVCDVDPPIMATVARRRAGYIAGCCLPWYARRRLPRLCGMPFSRESIDNALAIGVNSVSHLSLGRTFYL